MITIAFSCDECGLQNIHVQVRAREKTEDVVKYMEWTVGLAVQHEHTKRSPQCKNVKISRVAIPCGEENDPEPWVGKQCNSKPPSGMV